MWVVNMDRTLRKGRKGKGRRGTERRREREGEGEGVLKNDQI